jgi:hypothetical protein
MKLARQLWILAVALASHVPMSPATRPGSFELVRLPAATEPSPSAPADAVLDASPRSQSLFYEELYSTSMRFHDLHKAQMPNVPRSLWQRMMREMVLTLQEAKLGLKMISRAGRPVRRSLMVTAVLSNVLPIPLFWIGAKVLAGIVLAVPFELIVPPAQMAIMGAHDLAREVWTLGNDPNAPSGGNLTARTKQWMAHWKRGMETYQRSRELRRQLLGMPDRARILTLMDERIMAAVDADPNNHWIAISRDSSSNRGLLGQSVDLAELEAIARHTENGRELLDGLRGERARGGTYALDVYAMEVWQLIQSEEKTRQELQELLKPRLRNTVGTETVRLARHMAEARDLKRMLIESEEKLADALKEAQTGAPSATKVGLKKLIGDLTDSTLTISKAMSEIETQMLVAQLRGETTPMSMEPIVASARELQRRYGQTLPMAKTFGEDRRITVATLRHALGLPAAEPRRGLRSEPRRGLRSEPRRGLRSEPRTPGRVASAYKNCATSLSSLLGRIALQP